MFRPDDDARGCIAFENSFATAANTSDQLTKRDQKTIQRFAEVLHACSPMARIGLVESIGEAEFESECEDYAEWMGPIHTLRAVASLYYAGDRTSEAIAAELRISPQVAEQYLTALTILWPHTRKPRRTRTARKITS